MSDKTTATTGMGASHHHPAPTSFIWKYIFSTDHKVIAKQYLFNGLFFLLLAGIFALLIRWQLAYPFEPIPLVGGLFSDDGAMLPEHYTKLFTNHGALMIFFAITPIVIGAFGNFAIPLQIGAPDMAFPRLNMYSYWVLVHRQRHHDRLVVCARRRRRFGLDRLRAALIQSGGHARMGPDALGPGDHRCGHLQPHGGNQLRRDDAEPA